MSHYKLYGTQACHLCEVAEAMIESLRGEDAFTLEKIDVSGDDALFERYGLRIPVLANAQGGELAWPFAEDQLRVFLVS